MSHIDIEMKDVNVMLGMPTHRDINPMVVKAIFETKQHCDKLNVKFNFGFVWGGSVITTDRNRVVDLFLESEANRLFWIDSDIVWESQDFIRLLALSQKYDVVCATYPAKKTPTTFYIKFVEQKYNEHGLIEIEGAGLGFTVVSRDAIEKLAGTKRQVMNQIDNKAMADIFRIDEVDGNLQTEDMAFFADLRALGYPILLDPEVSLGHIGVHVYKGSIKDALE